MIYSNLSHAFLKKTVLFCVIIILLSQFGVRAAGEVERWLVPNSIRHAILNEFSGEAALRHVEILSVDRNRQGDEYAGWFMETEYIHKMANQYGFSNVKADLFPAKEIWDAEKAELWLIEPVKRKIAALDIVPEALASGSLNADITAEVVYVGAGRNQDFKGKSLKNKIVMGNSSVSRLFRPAVISGKAFGVLGTGSSGEIRGYPGVSQDQLGWQSIRPEKDGKGFGFVLSKRQFDEIHSYLEQDKKVVMRAIVQTRMLPYQMNVVSAEIPGTDPEAKELLMVAHLFERIATPGANDNCSGVATILEAGRSLIKLIDEEILPRPKRTIRFLWVPEISGTREFMYKYPEMQDQLLTVLNFDMTGADLKTTDAYLRMKMTPDSCPSFLNDLIANLLLCADQTIIRTQWGTNSQFNYRLCPYISGSDHTIFLAAGIPAMQFNYYGDNFYHSSEDRSKHVDPTEMKRVGFIAASAFYFLADADAEEARALAWESAANGGKWMSEVFRQSINLMTGEADKLHTGHGAALNKLEWAYHRGRGGVESVLEVSEDEQTGNLVRELTAGLSITRDALIERLSMLYKFRCDELNIEQKQDVQEEAELENSRLFPRKLFKIYTEDYKSRNENVNKHMPKKSPVIPGMARSEIPNFIDGERSILDIYHAVRAEHAFVDTSDDDTKYAYVITPDAPDVQLQSVVDLIKAMEKAGLIEIVGKKEEHP